MNTLVNHDIIFEPEELLQVTSGHIHSKRGNVLEMVQTDIQAHNCITHWLANGHVANEAISLNL